VAAKVCNFAFFEIIQIHVFSIGQGKMVVDKVFLRSDVTKVKLRKECKIDFRVF